MELTPFWQLLTGLGMVSLLMAILWLIQRIKTDAGVVDVGWAGGVGILAIWFAATSGSEIPFNRRLMVGGLGAIWAFRLAAYLLFNRVLGKSHEDGRYQVLRAHFGSRAQLYFFWFFQAQSLLAVFFAVPFMVALHAPRAGVNGWSLWDIAGIVIWGLAVGGESLADAQLAGHRANPENRGKTCRAGLWNLSRHPNYFFEWLHWWAWVCFGFGHPLWVLSLCAPSLMLYFLLRVTGIPYTEAQALRSRGDDYRRYQEEVSMFFPWFPQSRHG